MIECAKDILEFIIIFLLVYFGYYIFLYKKIDKYNRKKAPVNIKYLVNRYKLDVVGLGYKRIFKTLMISDSFIVATLFIITKTIDNIYLIAMYYKKESER